MQQLYFICIVKAKSDPRSYEYIELQKTDRNIAARYAWITATVYGTAYGAYNAVFPDMRFADDAAGPLLGVFLSFAVFLFAAAARDALLPLRDRNTILTWVIFTVSGVLWTVMYLVRAIRRGDFTHGMITAGMLELFAALLVVSLGIFQSARMLRRRKTDL